MRQPKISFARRLTYGPRDSGFQPHKKTVISAKISIFELLQFFPTLYEVATVSTQLVFHINYLPSFHSHTLRPLASTAMDACGLKVCQYSGTGEGTGNDTIECCMMEYLTTIMHAWEIMVTELVNNISTYDESRLFIFFLTLCNLYLIVNDWPQTKLEVMGSNLTRNPESQMLQLFMYICISMYLLSSS